MNKKKRKKYFYFFHIGFWFDQINILKYYYYNLLIKFGLRRMRRGKCLKLIQVHA